MDDYYNLLGVPPTASLEAIRRAFRERAKAVHPDAQPHRSPVQREALQRQFVLLAQAYETLRHPVRRAEYDRRRAALGSAPGERAGGPGGTRAGPEQAARSGQGGHTARPRSAGPSPQPPPQDESLEDLLRDVEQLLARFGLELRQPFEAVLEALLDWARAVFRQVMEAWEEVPGASPQARAEARAHAARRAGTTERPRPSGGVAGRRPPMGGRAARMQEELDRVRLRVRRSAAAAGAAAAAGSGEQTGKEADIEAELRRLKQRLGRV